MWLKCSKLRASWGELTTVRWCRRVGAAPEGSAEVEASLDEACDEQAKEGGHHKGKDEPVHGSRVGRAETQSMSGTG